MITLEYLLTLAPSPAAVEKVLDALSRLAPHQETVWRVLHGFASLAPSASSVRMLPFLALVAAVVHAGVTRRVGMIVAAAFVVFFYAAGRMVLPEAPGLEPPQRALLILLHTWFSCAAAYLFFVCLGCSMITELVTAQWRKHRLEKERRSQPHWTTVASAKRSVPVRKEPTL